MILEECPPPRESKLEILYDEISYEISNKRKQIDKVDNQIEEIRNQISLIQQYREAQERIYREEGNDLQLRLEKSKTKILQLLSSYDAETKYKITSNPLTMLMRTNKLSDNEESAAYTSTIEAAFGEQQYLLSPFIVNRQIQLCRYVHYLTMHKNQLYLLQLQSSEYIKCLEIEKQNQTQKMQTNKNELLEKKRMVETEVKQIEALLIQYSQSMRQIFRRHHCTTSIGHAVVVGIAQ